MHGSGVKDDDANWVEGRPLKHTAQDIETREEVVTKGSRCDQKMSYAEEPFCSTE